MKDKQPSKKKRFVKIMGIFSVIISLILSSAAYHSAMKIDDLKSGENGYSSMSKISTLYGTHGCEEGGFSIQLGQDINDDGVLDAGEPFTTTDATGAFTLSLKSPSPNAPIKVILLGNWLKKKICNKTTQIGTA